MVIQVALTFIGAAAFCIYSYSWCDVVHLIYDVPAGLCTFGFIAQLVVEAPASRCNGFWLYRGTMVVAMTLATVGRTYWGWMISGHLSCVLAIALVQSADGRLSRIERAAYWIPVPIVLFLRFALLEHDGHFATYAGLAFGLTWGIMGALTFITQYGFGGSVRRRDTTAPLAGPVSAKRSRQG